MQTGLRLQLSSVLFLKSYIDNHEVSIKAVADFFHIESKKLTDYYKEHLSGYRLWNQLSHADEYIYFRDNLDENISIDKTAFSNGELYTVVTNKDGHGRLGTVIAMIRGTKADDVCRYLMKLPKGKRRMVKNITLDMAGSMRQIARRCFPKATQIIDRFHIQK